jgi:membrane protein
MSGPTDEPASPPDEGAAGPAGAPEAASPAPTLRERVADTRARADEVRRVAGERFEAERGRRVSVRIAGELWERDRRFAGGLLAGGLAFRVFLWLLPVALVVVCLTGIAAGLLGVTSGHLASGAGMSTALTGAISQAVSASGRGRVGLLVLGLVLAAMAGRGVVRALRVIGAVAWQMGGPTRASYKESAIFAGWAVVMAAIPFLGGPLYSGGLGTDLLAMLLLTSAFAAAGFWGLIVLPRPEEVRWRSLVPGAILFGIGFEFTRVFTAVYLVGKLERSSNLYGSFGLTVVFMAWLYLIARFVVGGIGLNAAAWEGAAGRTAPEGGAPEGGEKEGEPRWPEITRPEA